MKGTEYVKPITFDHPDKMHFESGHKAFDRQTVILTPGNVIAPTQFSSYIRPAQETECNGQTWSEGHLQRFDLQSFAEYGLSHCLDEVRKIINERGTQAILYLFRHKSGERIIEDGLLLTTGADEGYLELQRWYLNSQPKASSAFEEAIRYVTNPKPE